MLSCCRHFLTASTASTVGIHVKSEVTWFHPVVGKGSVFSFHEIYGVLDVVWCVTHQGGQNAGEEFSDVVCHRINAADDGSWILGSP